MNPLVLLPGLGCDTSQFRFLTGAFSDGFDVRALELPGHHGAPAVAGRASLDAVAEEVATRVPAGSVLVGHSTGGIVGLVIAARHPSLVERLVLLDSNVPVTPEALARKVARAADVRGPVWRTVLEESMRSSWGPRRPELREEVVAGILATPEAALRPLWFDVLALDPRPLLAALRVPALHVRSSRDVDAAALHALNPGVGSVDLRELSPGHWPHLTEPDAVVSAVRRWVPTWPAPASPRC